MLLNCPCCEGKAVVSKRRSWKYDGPRGRKDAYSIVLHYVRCMFCELRTKEIESESEVINIWNRRMK